MFEFLILKRNKLKLNNRGMTLTELVVAFALLSLFMVAATRMISYTINVYYAAKGTSYGLEVSNMISEKIVGHIEGASNKQSVSFVETDPAKGEPPEESPSGGDGGSGGSDDEEPTANPIVKKPYNAVSDCIKFCDSTGSIVSIYADEQGYIVVHYDEVKTGSVPYDAVDWRFDRKAYMGYAISSLNFENPGTDYPKNVIKMRMVLTSLKYGNYSTTYYIKCPNVEEIRWE